MPTADDVTLQEVARTLADMRQEFRTQLATLVRTDVYRAEQAAMSDRIKRVEVDMERAEGEKAREVSEKDSFRRMVVGSFLAAGGTFVVALIMFVISLVVHN